MFEKISLPRVFASCENIYLCILQTVQSGFWVTFQSFFTLTVPLKLGGPFSLFISKKRKN